MHISFPQEHIVVALQLDLATILRFEQHTIANFHGSHVRTDAHDTCPGKSPAHLRGSGNDDATAGAPFAVFGALPH